MRKPSDSDVIQVLANHCGTPYSWAWTFVPEAGATFGFGFSLSTGLIRSGAIDGPLPIPAEGAGKVSAISIPATITWNCPASRTIGNLLGSQVDHFVEVTLVGFY